MSKRQELGDAFVVEGTQFGQHSKEGLRLTREVQGVGSLVNIDSFKAVSIVEEEGLRSLPVYEKAAEQAV